MEEEVQNLLNENTQESERRSADRPAGADREPSAEEEAVADEAAQELEESGELESAGEHEKEMTRLGAQVKGEGEIP